MLIPLARSRNGRVILSPSLQSRLFLLSPTPPRLVRLDNRSLLVVAESVCAELCVLEGVGYQAEVST